MIQSKPGSDLAVPGLNFLFLFLSMYSLFSQFLIFVTQAIVNIPKVHIFSFPTTKNVKRKTQILLEYSVVSNKRTGCNKQTGGRTGYVKQTGWTFCQK